MNPMENRNLRKERIGIVISNRMNKTIVVAEKRKVKHSIYGKFINRTTKFMAHDETNNCSVGDIVRIMESRPMSKSKTWRVVEIIERAK
jgi:small subunit ribosomal protein S17